MKAKDGGDDVQCVIIKSNSDDDRNEQRKAKSNIRAEFVQIGKACLKMKSALCEDG